MPPDLPPRKRDRFGLSLVLVSLIFLSLAALEIADPLPVEVAASTIGP